MLDFSPNQGEEENWPKTFLKIVSTGFGITHLVLMPKYFVVFIAEFCLCLFVFISMLFFTQYKD